MKPNAQGRVFLLLLWWLALSVTPSLYSSDPEPILAPFGLSWGLAPEDLEEILRRSKILITTKEKEGDTLRIEATGLPQKKLLRVMFHFEEDLLCEVELQLGQPSWSASDYTRFFLETKKVLDARYGRGLPLVLEKRTVGDVETFLGGYCWSQFGGNIRLFLFQASNHTEETQVLSQHYRAF